MKRAVQSLLLLCLVISTAQAKTCSDIKLSAGKDTWSACEDYWIKIFEGHLEKITNSSKKPSSTRKVIAAWRDTTYSNCENMECLRNEYVRQISTFSEKVISAYDIKSNEIDDIEQKNICNSIAKLTESDEISNFEQIVIPYDFLREIDGQDGWRLTREELATLGTKLTHEEPEHVYKVKLSGSGRTARFGSFFTGGSCSSHNIYNIDLFLDPSTRDYRDVIVPVDDLEDEIRWEYWGDGDVPYMISGRNLLIAGSLVSWINPRGKILPLCMIGSSATSRKWTMRNKENICNAVDSAKNILELFSPLKEIDQNSLSQIEREEMREHVGLRETYTTVGHLDLDGDGRKETMLHNVTDSGGGCGSHTEAVRLLSVDGQQNRALAGLLSELPGQGLKIAEINSKYYISAWDSADRRITYLIDNGKLAKMCESTPVWKYKVKRYFHPIVSDEM